MEMNIIPSFKIDLNKLIGEEVHSNIQYILDSGMFAGGKYVRECEELIRNKIDSKYVYMVASGSAALEACAYTLKEKHGLGKVLIPANTFVATSLAFERLGFAVDFYRNGITEIDFEIPEGYIGIVIVDLGGVIPFDIEDFIRKCHSKGMWVCEDACQALGSHLRGRQAGTFGDISAFSFFSTKVLTAGEGGAVIVNNPDYVYFVEMYRDFGKTEPWVSYHKEKGWNCRMNEFGAAILSVQLKYCEEIIQNRGLIRIHYRHKLKDYAEKLRFLPAPDCNYFFNGYKVITFLDKSIDKEEFIKFCNKNGVKIQGSVYNWILSEQPIYLNKEPIAGKWNYAWKRMICLPSWYGMTREETDYTIKVINMAFGG